MDKELSTILLMVLCVSLFSPILQTAFSENNITGFRKFDEGLGAIALDGYWNEAADALISESCWIEGIAGNRRIVEPLVNRRMVADEYTLALWHFDEGSGQQVFDGSGHQNTGRLGSLAEADSRDPSWTSGFTGTAGDYALSMDDWYDYVYVADNPDESLDLLQGDEFTVEFWTYVRNVSRPDRGSGYHWNAFLGKWSPYGTLNTFSVGQCSYYPQLSALFFDSAGTNYGVGCLPPPTLRWVHVMFVYNGKHARVYYDGVLAGEEETGHQYVGGNSEPLSIGKSLEGDEPWRDSVDCVIDEVRISSIARDEWPMFHHDLSNTGYSASAAPETSTVFWNYTTQGPVVSSAAVVGGRVCVGSDDNRLYCLNATTGVQLWNYTTGDSVRSSPAIDNDIVYFGSDDHKCYALNITTGVLMWNFTTGGPVRSSPAVINGRLYAGSGDWKLYCLNSTTGALIWNYSTTGAVDSSPAVIQDRIFAGSMDGQLYCLNSTTGALIWNYSTAWQISSSPTVYAGRVYVGSKGGWIYCLNATTGTQLWNYTAGQGIGSSPAIAYDRVCFGSDDNMVYCVNATTGDSIWNFTCSGPVDSSPAIAAGKIYVGSCDDRIYCLNMSSGVQIWQYTSGGNVTSSPAIADSKVFVGSTDGQVYAFGTPGIPPVASFDYTPSFVIANETITFNASASEPNEGIIIDFTWDFGDGTNGSGVVVYHQFLIPGNYTVTLNVTDTEGLWHEAEQTVRVWPPVHDVAVLDVAPLHSAIGEGYVLPIDVEVENQGSYVEVFNVTLYANATEIQKQVANLSYHASAHLLFNWNTTGLATGTYTLWAKADHLLLETDFIDNEFVNGNVSITPPVHDVSVTNVRPHVVFVTLGTTLNVYVTAENQGNMLEVFNVSLLIDSLEVHTTRVTMDLNETLNLVLEWNTMGYSLANYSISASADIVAGEVDIEDNLFVYGEVTLVEGTYMYVYPSVTIVELNQTFYVDIHVSYVENAGAWQVEMHFNASLIEWISGGTLVWGHDDAIWQIGWLPSPFSGNLMRITFKAKVAGSTLLWLPCDHDNEGVYGCKLIMSDATPIPFEAIDGFVKVGTHDVAVSTIELCEPIICCACPRHINATIWNYGDLPETFNVTLYGNSTIVQTQLVTIPNGASTTITFIWNTTGFARGNYSISVHAWPVLGEANTTNNTLTGGNLFLTILGDVNGDAIVDVSDITLVIEAFQKTSNSPGWLDPQWYTHRDLNCDGIIDVTDITLVIEQYGSSW